ncbi:precorrin-2 dehydrogenase/sirohydrochlorin ferrochelatase family protein [Acidisoma sp. C75]
MTRMIPVSLDPRALRLALAGHGGSAQRRWQLLAEAGADTALCFADEPDAVLAAAAGPRYREGLPDEASLAKLDVLWIVGMPDAEAIALAERARGQKILVNVEDRRAHCVFHNAAEVRRGDLLLTISTNGQSPGLAQKLRSRLGMLFGPEWAERLAILGRKRAEWRAAGDELPALAAKTDAFLQETGWLDELAPQRK